LRGACRLCALFDTYGRPEDDELAIGKETFEELKAKGEIISPRRFTMCCFP
jgi:hypothetical protein